MKYLLPLFLTVTHLDASAQSPYLSVLVKMDSAGAQATRYKIEMKICEVKKSERGGWFTHDTSNINFSTLKPGDVDCSEYFDKGMPTLLSGEEDEEINRFQFSGQVFAWEHIFIYKISNMSSRGWMPEMFIVVPVKYKSFFTKIDISEIEFQPGKVIFLTDLEGRYDERQLLLSRSLKNKKAIDKNDFLLASILDQK